MIMMKIIKVREEFDALKGKKIEIFGEIKEPQTEEFTLEYINERIEHFSRKLKEIQEKKQKIMELIKNDTTK